MEIGQLYVRRSALINARPSRVWAEFKTFERIAAWLDRGHKLHVFDPCLGGKVEFSVDIEGIQRKFGGRINTFEAERELSLSDDWIDKDFAFYAGERTYWTFRLTAIAESTLVELFHHGYENFGNDAHQILEDYEIGWDNKHLKKLREIVELDQSGN